VSSVGGKSKGDGLTAPKKGGGGTGKEGGKETSRSRAWFKEEKSVGKKVLKAPSCPEKGKGVPQLNGTKKKGKRKKKTSSGKKKGRNGMNAVVSA